MNAPDTTNQAVKGGGYFWEPPPGHQAAAAVKVPPMSTPVAEQSARDWVASCLSAPEKRTVRRRGSRILAGGVLTTVACGALIYGLVRLSIALHGDPFLPPKILGIAGFVGLIAIYAGIFYLITGLPVDFTGGASWNKLWFFLGFLGVAYGTARLALAVL